MKGQGISPAALGALLNGDLDNFVTASIPGGIEAQEKAGQTMFVANSTLPKEMLHGCTREALEKMGIVFGADADDLFVTVKLPEGWKKQATDHSMWSDLLDDKGRVRASIFYKAAFYDRKAHISLLARYGFNTYRPCNSSGEACEHHVKTHLKTVVTDGYVDIHTVGWCAESDYQAKDRLSGAATRWLDENFPDWRDPLAYWD